MLSAGHPQLGNYCTDTTLLPLSCRYGTPVGTQETVITSGIPEYIRYLERVIPVVVQYNDRANEVSRDGRKNTIPYLL